MYLASLRLWPFGDGYMSQCPFQKATISDDLQKFGDEVRSRLKNHLVYNKPSIRSTLPHTTKKKTMASFSIFFLQAPMIDGKNSRVYLSLFLNPLKVSRRTFNRVICQGLLGCAKLDFVWCFLFFLLRVGETGGESGDVLTDVPRWDVLLSKSCFI